MERRTRQLAGVGLALMMAAAPGCRSTRPEVPPGRPYAANGRQAPPLEFGSEPHPAVNVASPYPGNAAPGGSPPSYGTPSPGAGERYGAPTDNVYGPPGTSVGGAPAGAPGVSPGGPSAAPATP